MDNTAAIMDEKTVIFIPARGGSKRLPHKNKLLLQGKPLFAYSVNAALESKVTPHIYVLSDDSEILMEAKKLGVSELNLPGEMASDTAEVVKPMLYALQKLKEDHGLEFDNLICLQPSSPLRNAEDIQRSFQKFKETNANSLVSVAELDPHYFHWAVEVNATNNLGKFFFGKQYLKSRVELPLMYWPNGAIKIAKNSSLREQQHFFGEKMAVYIMPSERSVHIATKFEFNFCKYIIENKNNVVPK